MVVDVVLKNGFISTGAIVFLVRHIHSMQGVRGMKMSTHKHKVKES